MTKNNIEDSINNIYTNGIPQSGIDYINNRFILTGNPNEDFFLTLLFSGGKYSREDAITKSMCDYLGPLVPGSNFTPQYTFNLF